MGADFLLTCCEVPDWLEDTVEARQRAKALIVTAVEKYEMWDQGFVEAAGDNATDLASGKAEAVRLLEATVEDIICGQCRDVTYMYFGGKQYCFTGGVSWGDDPTEAFAGVSLLSLAEFPHDWSLDVERIDPSHESGRTRMEEERAVLLAHENSLKSSTENG